MQPSQLHKRPAFSELHKTAMPGEEATQIDVMDLAAVAEQKLSRLCRAHPATILIR
jgi:hypothetical protein